MSTENVTMKVEETKPKKEVEKKPERQQVSLLQIPISTENDALNMLVAFLQVAQKRGAFTLEEAGKIMESVNKFQRTNPVAEKAKLETVKEETVKESKEEKKTSDEGYAQKMPEKDLA
tara:strand:- start:1933 stop:2286 length:354 start_codon:yes stop_codon:yes gene_type:complete